MRHGATTVSYALGARSLADVPYKALLVLHMTGHAAEELDVQTKTFATAPSTHSRGWKQVKWTVDCEASCDYRVILILHANNRDVPIHPNPHGILMFNSNACTSPTNSKRE